MKILTVARITLRSLVLIGACACSFAGRAALADPARAKPTIVLVHGAWADGSSWDLVTQRLERDGYAVLVTANPLRGIANDSAYLAAILKTIPGPIVLVGHSYGGAVITNAGVGIPNVKELVYIDAFAPDQGENMLQLAMAEPGSALAAPPQNVFDAVPLPGAKAATDVDVYLKSSIFHDAFANDIPFSQAAILAARQRPAALTGAAEPSGIPAWKSVPSWFLIGTADHVIPPAEQTKMAERAHGHIVRVNASHLSMISQPAAVESLIIGAAHDCWSQ